MSNAKSTRGGFDWSAGHGPVSGTVNVSGGLLATGMVGYLADMPPYWGAIGAGAGLVAHCVSCAARHVSRAGVLARAAGWVAGGGWLTYALATSPWSATSLGSLAAASVAGGVTASVMSAAKDRKTGVALRMHAALEKSRQADDWESRIARVCGIKGAQIEGREVWEQGTGFTLDVNLPPGGKSWRDLANHAPNLAADADLPEGCGVEVGPGATRRAALVKVSTVNTLAELVPYPEEITPLTINNPIPLGLHRDASEAGIGLRSDTLLLVGQRGGGKTNELQVINAGLVRCVDTLVWHIDLNGGGMSLPWLMPWREGRMNKPVIDWVASTPEEALEMTEAALRIAKGRKVEYAGLRRQHGDDKLPVSPQVPAIEIVTDECAEAIGENTKHRKLAQNLEELQRIARAEAVGQAFSGLRATTDVIGSTAILKQSRARVCMRVSDPEEINYLFGWNCKATPEDIPYEGCGLYLQDTGGQPKAFKGYRLVGQRIEDIAIACEDYRPGLDKASAELAGRAYATRWDEDRIAHLFRGSSSGSTFTVEPTGPAAPETTTETEDPVPSLASAQAPRSPMDQLADAGMVFTGQANTTPRAGAVDWSDPETWPAPNVPGVESPTTPAAIVVPELVARVVSAMREHGGDRMHSADLADAVGIASTRLGGLLSQVGLRPLPNAFEIGGRERRGYSRADAEAVAERIRAGAVEVPAEVADWTADDPK